MGITCSLLGHAFEETEIERERTEQGDEVVTVVREVERCGRCGEERVVSENTEVTAVVEPEEVAADEADGDGDDGERPDPAAGESAGEEFEPPDDPAEEDAEILEDEGRSERAPGQWPDEDEPFDPGRLADEPESEPESAVEHVEEAGPDEATAVGDADDPPEEPLDQLGRVGEESAAYVCPDCGFTTEAATSSLRKGDSCPECQVGWLQVERNP